MIYAVLYMLWAFGITGWSFWKSGEGLQRDEFYLWVLSALFWPVFLPIFWLDVYNVDWLIKPRVVVKEKKDGM